MRCPNCDYEYSGGPACPYCGVDTVLFTKTAAISDALYNRGLAKAQALDLTGAVGLLSKSLEFNKNNISARNLIGLCYYEIGYVGDALKHWVISGSILKEKNPAKRYIEIVQKDERALKRLTDAVSMYNQALGYLQQKSDDMAIIQLKKAVELNPKFIDACNLLSLCHLIQRDKEKAADTIEKTLSMDVNNPVALNYYNQVFGPKQRREQTARQAASRAPKTAAGPQARPRQPYTMPRTKDNGIFGGGFRFNEIIAFVVGAACVAALLFTLYMPAKIRAKDAEISSVSAQKTAADQSYANRAADYEQQIQEKDTAYGDLEARYDRLQTQADALAVSEKIARAETLAASGDFQGAADAAATVDTRAMSQDLAQRYEQVKSQAWKALVGRYLAEGVDFYNSSEFESAKSSLEKAAAYIPGVDPQDADEPKVYYYLGLASEKLEATDDAAGYYQTVVDSYPDSAQFSSARSKAESLSSQ